MKIVPAWILVACLCALVVSCSPDATPSAPESRKSVAPPAQVASLISLEPSKKATPTPSKLSSGSDSIRPDDLRDLESRGLLRWLPRDSLVVLRVPHVELLSELPGRCGLASLFQGPLMAAALSAPDSPLGKLRTDLHESAPELDMLIELLPSLRGELVVALTHFAPTAKPRATPVSFALAYSAASDADAIGKALTATLDRLQREHPEIVKRSKDKWGYHGTFQDAHFEIQREGHVFTAIYSTDPSTPGRPLPPASRLIEESFAKAPVVLASPDLNLGEQGVLEIYLHAQPMWEMIRTEALPEGRDIFERLGLFDLDGASFALALDEKGVSETLTWCASTGADLVSRILAGAPAKREVGRWIPADATTAGLYRVDVKALFDAIANSLPLKDATVMAQGLAEMKTQTGIDPRQDLIQNFGPAFAIVSRGDPLALMNGFSGMCFAIETQDAARTEHVIDVILASLPSDVRVKTVQIAGRDVLSIDLQPVGVPLAAILVCQVEGALLLATDDKLLERCLVAGRTKGVKQPELSLALEGEGVIGAGLSAAVGDLPRTLSILRRTASGFQISSHDGAGAMGGSSLAVIPILASVAIPKLLSARLSANEAAAISTLRSISSAEAMVQSSGIVDLDQDGIGEYAFLGEMAGTLAVRGSNERIEPAVLSSEMGNTTDGKLTRAGYLFQVWLPAARANSGLCESKAKNGRDISADQAELQFIVYAWPIEAGSTGKRVLAVRNHSMYECEDARGKYASTEHGPAFDAMLPAKKDVDPETSGAYVGRDGLTWKIID